MNYSLASSTWDGKELKAIQAVIESDIFTMGKKVAEFEKDFAQFVGAKYAVMTSSGSTANLVPAGFGNAHLVRSREAVYYYKCAYKGEYMDAESQFTYAWNDERIGIDWGIKNPILSQRDVLATREKG